MREIVVADIGGTYTRVARLKNGKILDYSKKETPKTRKEILEELLKNIIKCINKDTHKIGISCAGVIENGVIEVSPNLPLENFNLKNYLEKKLKLKVEIENDVNCLAIAEAKFGVRKKNFIVLTFGTGIGGGIIIDGKLYRGKGGAGELGHIIINNKKDFESLYKSSKSNREKLADYIGQGIASLYSVFDPEIIVLDGGMRKGVGENFINKIKYKTEKYMFLPRKPNIAWSKLEHPELLGAGLLFE